MAKVGRRAGTSPFAAPTRAWTLAALPVAVIWSSTQNASSPLVSRAIETSQSSRPATSLRYSGVPVASVTAIEMGRPAGATLPVSRSSIIAATPFLSWTTLVIRSSRWASRA